MEENGLRMTLRAAASYINYSPSSGVGNTEVGVSSTEQNTGRSSRTTTGTFQTTNGSPAKFANLEIVKSGKPEFVDMIASIAANRDGGNVTITGTSNSPKLTFTLQNGSPTTIPGVTLPAQYTAGGVQTNNGAAIAGDPGNTAEYAYSITILIPKNEGVTARNLFVKVQDEAGVQKTCEIIQPASEPVLTLSQNSITLDWQGNPVTITVTSNTSWTAS